MLSSFTKGDWIGAYQVESRLRSGGMATLFLARRSGAAGFSRLAAIKVIHPHLSQDERFVRMFVDEARISSKISHPNVVHVEEFGEEGGLFFLVMEYVDGCSASQLLRMVRNENRKLPADLAAHIAFKVAEGLHSAHETLDDQGNLLGIVHRDVSPSNILLSAEGNIKIIDFGIAKARGRIAGTETGYALKGKIRYMSPEQARGKEVDRRSDVYAVGVVLWELLAADRAFEADNEFALLEKVRDGQLRSIRDIRPDVPEALEAVIRQATSQNPDERPESAYALSRLIARACPDALLVDQRSFSELISRVPRGTRNRDGATPSGSNTGASWVSDLSTSRPSESAPARLAAGSAPRSNRAPTRTDVFDPELFVEPTPLPSPAPLPGYADAADDMYDSVVVDAAPSRSPAPVAAADAKQPWLTTNRTILIAASLVAIGLMAGIIFGSRGGDAPAPPAAAVTPAVMGESATKPTEAATKPTEVKSATDPAASKSAVESAPPEPAKVEPSVAEAVRAAKANKPAKIEDGAGTAKTVRARRPRRSRVVKPEKVASDEKATPARRVDGLLIADDPDDDVEVSNKRRRKVRTDEPGRAGKTPIAEGFDD